MNAPIPLLLGIMQKERAHAGVQERGTIVVKCSKNQDSFSGENNV